jgi:FAD synthetase
MCFGTFDLLHTGHVYFLNNAKKHGKLYIILARDERVAGLKGRKTIHNISTRKRMLKLLGYENVLYGHKTDVYYHIKKYKPDVICLGYDQFFFTQNLKRFGTLVVRIKPLIPNLYKTTLMRGIYERKPQNKIR